MQLDLPLDGPGLPLEEPGLPLGRCPPFFHPQALSGLVGEAYLPLCPRCLFSLDHSKFHLAQLGLGKIFSHSFQRALQVKGLFSLLSANTFVRNQIQKNFRDIFWEMYPYHKKIKPLAFCIDSLQGLFLPKLVNFLKDDFILFNTTIINRLLHTPHIWIIPGLASVLHLFFKRFFQSLSLNLCLQKMVFLVEVILRWHWNKSWDCPFVQQRMSLWGYTSRVTLPK